MIYVISEFTGMYRAMLWPATQDYMVLKYFLLQMPLMMHKQENI